jgi:hypothetical protein
MQKYWLRIFIGAFAIFAIGMVGVNLVRRGHAKFHTLLASADPLSIPLGFVPFVLEGERLGQLEEVVILRNTPRQVRAVELEVDLADSLVAQGLRGCRLAANFESDPKEPGLNIRASRGARNTFSCLAGDSTPAEFVEFGEAIFQPGEVRVPLYLQAELVTEMHQALAADSTSELAEANADSLADLAELKADSAAEAAASAATRSADSVGRAGRRLGDSLRAAALRHADSMRAELGRMADTLPRK